MRTLKMGISGTHGSGKSTLVQNIQSILNKSEYSSKCLFEVCDLSMSKIQEEIQMFNTNKIKQPNSFDPMYNTLFLGQSAYKLVYNHTFWKIISKTVDNSEEKKKLFMFLTDRTPLDFLQYTMYYYLKKKFDTGKYIDIPFMDKECIFVQYKQMEKTVNEIISLVYNFYDIIFIPKPLDLNTIENNTGNRVHDNIYFQQDIFNLFKFFDQELIPFIASKFELDESIKPKIYFSENTNSDLVLEEILLLIN